MPAVYPRAKDHAFVDPSPHKKPSSSPCPDLVRPLSLAPSRSSTNTVNPSRAVISPQPPLRLLPPAPPRQRQHLLAARPSGGEHAAGTAGSICSLPILCLRAQASRSATSAGPASTCAEPPTERTLARRRFIARPYSRRGRGERERKRTIRARSRKRRAPCPALASLRRPASGIPLIRPPPHR